MPGHPRRVAASLSGMSSLTTDIAGLGLFARRSDLLALGHSDGELKAGVIRGTIIRVRQGWYTLASAPATGVEAFRIGGRLAGLSSLQTHGIWTPATRRLHVTVPSDARGLRRPTDMRCRLDAADGGHVRLTWTDRTADWLPPYVWRTSVIDALVHVLHNHDRVSAIVCLDAALHNRAEKGAGIVEADLDEIFARAPVRVQAWRAGIDGRAGSGGETEFRLTCLGAGIPFLPQPLVRGVGWLDGQIGPSTFVEIDGAQWHDNEVAFLADRERDILVADRGGRVLRFSYPLYRKQWDLCERVMRRALSDDYRLAKMTDFPCFTDRMKPRRGAVTANLRRIRTPDHRGIG